MPTTPVVTAYDVVAYPSAIFPQTDPERLAVLARLHGLTPPDFHTARVLDIGGGDGMNMLGFAAAHPRAHFTCFDLAESAIARGQGLARAAGLDNVTLETLDIMAARSHYAPRSFDYVIAHGVYAWVPDVVRAEVMALIGHVLADDGLAFVSFNAKPGGHVRQIMREMLQHEVGHLTDFDEKIAATRAFLKEVADRDPAGDSVKAAIYAQAKSMLSRPAAVLFHDEMGDCYNPQSIGEAVAAAQGQGLRFLTDAGRNRHLDGFIQTGLREDEDEEAALIRQAQTDDFAAMRFFRQPVFVRSSQMPSRAIDVGRMADFWVSASLSRTEDGAFVSNEDEIEIKDGPLAEALEALSAVYPERRPLTGLIDGDDRLHAVLEMFSQWYVGLHLGPPPYANSVPDRPQTSLLVRAQLEEGRTRICTLAHRQLAMEQPELRALLRAADGTKTVAELQADPSIGFSPDDVLGALAASVQRGLICRPD